jgi:hypothetical protein
MSNHRIFQNYNMTWAERRRRIKNFHRLADALWKAYDRMIRKRKKKKLTK